MADTRDQILFAIRKGLGRRGPLDEEQAADMEARLEHPTRNLVPARADRSAAARIELFVSMAEEAAATVHRVRNLDGVPKAVAAYLSSHNLPTEVAVAPDPGLEAVPWEKAAMISVRRGAAQPKDEVSVTPAFAGLAETGSLMLLSGAGHPSTLNLLPDTHIVVLHESQVVGGYEDGWDLLRARGKKWQMPRTVLFVTGPSRSADIEQTLQMGAHGPRRLHILLVKDGAKQKA